MPRSARSIVSGVVASPGGEPIGFAHGDLFRVRDFSKDHTARLPRVGRSGGIYGTAGCCVTDPGDVGR